MNLLDKIAYDSGGYTVKEILSSFCKKILEIIDLVNKNEEVCDEAHTIIENIRNEVVPELVEDIMKELQDDGYFDSLVNVTLIEQLRTELTTLLNQTITDYTNRLDNFDSQLDTKTKQNKSFGVFVTDFGAKCNGVDDDTSSIQQAINYAYDNNIKKVILSNIHYLKSTLYLKSNIELCGNNTRLIFDNPTVRLIIDNCENVTLKNFSCTKHGAYHTQIKNGSKNIKIEKVNYISDYEDFVFGACISLFNCSDVFINGCYFYKTGYQIIQEEGYSSNNVIVENCLSENCFNDFIELNCEKNAISTNWIIKNNKVYDVGLYQTTWEESTFGYKVYHWTNEKITTPITEGRFLGMTWCDNVLIESNIVDGVGGDSCLHIECPMNVTIKNNIFKNSNSTVSRFVWVGARTIIDKDTSLQSYNVKGGEFKLLIDGNTFMIDGKNVEGSNEKYIYFTGDNSTNSLDNFGFNHHYRVINNKFFYYEEKLSSPPYTDGYPRNPSTKYGTGISSMYWYSPIYIEGNSFNNLDKGLDLMRCRLNDFSFGSYINSNKFNSCRIGILIDEHSILSLEKNSFSNCTSALTYTDKYETTINNIKYNHFYNTTVQGLKYLMKNVSDNVYINSTTDDFNVKKKYSGTTTTVDLCYLSKSKLQNFNGILKVGARSTQTVFDQWHINLYSIKHFFLNKDSSYITGVNLISEDKSGSKVTGLTIALDFRNGKITATVTTTEDYEIYCELI